MITNYIQGFHTREIFLKEYILTNYIQTMLYLIEKRMKFFSISNLNNWSFSVAISKRIELESRGALDRKIIHY